MDAAEPGAYVLTTTWIPEARSTGPLYRLTLTNHGAAPLQGFRLAVSGPARIGEKAKLEGGRVVARLSNHCEIVPDPERELPPGGSWTVTITDLDFPVRHWTDGAAAAYLIAPGGAAIPVRTVPITLAGSEERLRRGTMRLGPGAPAETIAAIPWPAEVAVAGRSSAPAGFELHPTGSEAEAAAAAFTDLTRRLFAAEALVRPAAEGGRAVILELDPSLPEEGYAIAFGETIAVSGSDRRGLFYGLVTLGQIQRGARLAPARFLFPAAGRIADAPRFRWRGCHLDVARRYYPVATLEQFLAVLAWNKLNVFHWHLSDDEAFRPEVAAFPELADNAAWQGHEAAIPPLLGAGPERSGGVYSRRQISELIALAAAFGIDVVPEIDLPGHCYALLQALPQLRDPDETGLYHSIQGFPNNCLNPAVEAVYPAVEAILGELAELFPSRYFHVGADEVPPEAWADSPRAEAMRRELGANGAAPLQAHFLRRLQAFLSARGKITGAWEEAAEGGGIDKESCYLVGWRTAAAARELAAGGYDVVVAPGQAYYLDMANAAEWHECGAGWAGWSSPETTYAFEPAAGWSKEETARLLGVQACIWSEPMHDPAVFDRLVFPRLSAVAETAWTRADRRDFTRFRALADLMPNLFGQYEGALR